MLKLNSHKSVLNFNNVYLTMENQDRALWYLENIDVTNFFCPIKMGEAMETEHVKTFEKNEFVFLPNDNSDKIYMIIEGQIKIGTYSDNGKEITKSIISKGEVFGELSLVDVSSKRRDFAQAMESSKVCELSTDEMKSLIKDHSNLSLFFMKLIGSRILDMEKRLESMVFKDSRTRIIEYVLELVDKKGQRVGYEFVVRNFLTHQEIANITATSRQTVTTILNELKNKEILTFNRKRLLVRDLEKLKEEIVVNV